MKKNYRIIFALALVFALLVGCSNGPEAAPVVEDSSPEAEEEETVSEEETEEIEEAGVLLVGEMDFTRSQLEAMETLDVEYTNKDDTVTIFSGVLVLDLVAEAGLTGDTVVFVASDGYEAELALTELEGCPDCVVAFDGDELRMVLPEFPSNLQVKGVVEISLK